jgi:hypothetical protein
MMEADKEKQKEYYNCSAKPLPPLAVGDSIRYQDGKTWKQGIVTKEKGDRLYTVRSTEGAVYRRNRRHLIQSGEAFEPDASDANIFSSSEPSIPANPLRIRVRIDPPHPLVCRKRRLNGAVLRMRPEKPRSRVTVGVAR